MTIPTIQLQVQKSGYLEKNRNAKACYYHQEMKIIKDNYFRENDGREETKNIPTSTKSIRSGETHIKNNIQIV